MAPPGRTSKFRCMLLEVRLNLSIQLLTPLLVRKNSWKMLRLPGEQLKLTQLPSTSCTSPTRTSTLLLSAPSSPIRLALLAVNRLSTLMKTLARPTTPPPGTSTLPSSQTTGPPPKLTRLKSLSYTGLLSKTMSAMLSWAGTTTMRASLPLGTLKPLTLPFSLPKPECPRTRPSALRRLLL